MKEDYHFEKENQNFDETIRLDMINEKVKELKQQPNLEDELGDANAFLDAFESEKFDLPEDDFSDDMKPVADEAEGDTIHTIDTAAIQEAIEEADTLTKPLEQLPPEIPVEEPVEWDEEDDRLFGLGKRNATLLALAAVLACFMGFVFVRCTFHPTTVYEEPAAEAMPVLIQEVLEEGELLLYDVTTKAKTTVLLTEDTKITDEMNRELLPTHLQMGDLVLVGLDEENREVLSLQYSSAIESMEKSGLKANTASRMLESEEESFSYGEGAMFLYEEEPISAESIEPCDVLELKSYQDTVWCVEVEEYHGYITVKNADTVKNGMFQLDEEAEIPLKKAKKLPVRAGVHTIKITGDNIEPKTETVTVVEDKESFCDVSGVQEKVGVIIVNANVSDYKLYINGSTAENPAVLPFGEYEVVLIKGGYEDWSQTVSLQQDSVSIYAEMKEIEQPKQPEPPKEEKPAFQFGTLTITANCDGAVVYINGEQYGIAPMEVNLPYNSYTIRLEKEGYAPYEKGITIAEPTATLYAQLQ